MKKRVLLPWRSFSLIAAALAIGLPLLSLAAPVHATPASTFAELNFRRFNDEPFTDPGIYMVEYGTNLTSLSHTSPRGSIARFTADATAGTLRGFADAVNGNIAAGIPGDEVWARGHVQDYFTLHGPTPGAPMSITVSFSLDGTLSGSSSFPGTLEAFENAYVATTSSPNGPAPSWGWEAAGRAVAQVFSSPFTGKPPSLWISSREPLLRSIMPLMRGEAGHTGDPEAPLISAPRGR